MPAPASTANVRELAAHVTALTPGDPIATRSLVLVPLFSDRPGPDALLLEEALDRGCTEITEISDDAEVSLVRVRHRSRTPLLLLGGEQIIGAKQNRIFNASFLIPPQSDVQVPVSCVEQGRWHHDRQGFRAGLSTLHPEARSQKTFRVARSLTHGDGYDANQRAVWRDVDTYLTRTGVHSRTASFEDAVSSRRPQTEDAVRRLRPQPHQVGMALIRASRLCLIDIFGSPNLFRRAIHKIARGIFADLPSPESQVRDVIQPIRRTLTTLTRATGHRTPAPGSGHTLHGFAGELAFTALAHEGALYHATIGASRAA